MISGVVPRCVCEFNGRCPRRGGVADAALLGGDKVRCILPGCAGAIVAARTRPADARVVKSGRRPCRGGVAAAAVRRGGDVVSRLAGSGGAVMTCRT